MAGTPQGRIVGFVAVYLPDAFVHHLFVDPIAQRCGIGGALLARALALTGGRASLKCLRDNHGALAFYRQAGWSEAEESADEWGAWVRLRKADV